jgi:predicted nuclease of predicted toxin-antitoxin system
VILACVMRLTAKFLPPAQQAGVVVMTKDSDFVELVNRYGAPPQIIWLTCGNTSNARLTKILTTALPQAIALLGAGESLIEINATL